ncbi:hypothetical protein GCM10029976_060400 [Kribbella albertanoniae]
MPNLNRTEDSDPERPCHTGVRPHDRRARPGGGLENPSIASTQRKGRSNGLDRVLLRALGPPLLQVTDRPRTKPGPVSKLPLSDSRSPPKAPQHHTKPVRRPLDMPLAWEILLRPSGHRKYPTYPKQSQGMSWRGLSW